MFMLNKVENLQGGLSPRDFLRLNKTDGVWMKYELKCFFSKVLKLGECWCQDHHTWDTQIISRDEAKEIIGDKVMGLTPEELQSLNSPTLEDLAEEDFLLYGINHIRR
jgi:hypothetical protein